MKGAILVYDVTNRESFQKIDNWLNELETYSTNHDLIKMLVGNKVCVEFMEEGGGGWHIRILAKFYLGMVAYHYKFQNWIENFILN